MEEGRKKGRREGNKWCDNGLHVDHVEDSGAAGLPGPWDGGAHTIVKNMVGKIMNQNPCILKYRTSIACLS